MPHVQLSTDEVVGQKCADLLVKIGLVSSKSEAGRLVKNGGAYLNNKKIQDPAYLLSTEDLIDGSFLLLSAGKKNRMLISVSQ